MALAIYFTAGLVMLFVGAEMLVRGAVRLSLAAGLSQLLIGLTVVAVATSSPELAVSIGGALKGQPDLAIGNVVGSNIANILLILGLAALIRPLTVSSKLVQYDAPLMALFSVLTLLFALDGKISTFEGVVYLLSLVGYMFWLVRTERKNRNEIPEPDPTQIVGEDPSILFYFKHIMMLLIGLGVLIFGARLLVDSSVVLARMWGLNELIIGLTIIAVGTSMPEIATSMVSTYRGQSDLAAGNAIGSNLFNLLLVLGVAAMLAPDGLPVSHAALTLDIPFMLAVAIATLPIFGTGHQINRWEGGFFLAYYIIYLTYLVLDASHHEALPFFNMIMGFFVIPITVITLLIISYRLIRNRWFSEAQD